MKILLDENIDVRFKKSFPVSHDVYTIRDMGWNGVKNGELLKLLTEYHFGTWIVVDKNIPYQQNPAAIPCLIVVLDLYRNTLKYLVPLLPGILEVIGNPPMKKIVILQDERIR